MKVYTVNISLPPNKVELFYAGAARQVWARDVNGVSISFPIDVLRPFITHAGIYGRFKLFVTADNRLADVTRID